MENPIKLRVSLDERGLYYMELDTSKADCCHEPAHWHLCESGQKIGQISPYKVWTSYPNAETSIIQEAEWLTRLYCEKIINGYEHNRIYGTD